MAKQEIKIIELKIGEFYIRTPDTIENIKTAIKICKLAKEFYEDEE